MLKIKYVSVAAAVLVFSSYSHAGGIPLTDIAGGDLDTQLAQVAQELERTNTDDYPVSTPSPEETQALNESLESGRQNVEADLAEEKSSKH